MKRCTMLALLAILALLLAACASPEPEVPGKVVTQIVEKETIVEKVVAATATPNPMDSMEGRKIAALFSGPVNDAGWTTSAYRGLVSLRDEYGMEIAYTENVQASGQEQLFREYAQAGYDIVLGHGYEFTDAIIKAAKEFPNTKFIQNNGGESSIPNLCTINFSTGEGGYFMGMTGCLISKTGKIAYVAGSSFPILDHQIKMSRQACEDLGKEDVEVVEAYVGSWNDSARAKELASAAIENGVDVLILQADASDIGTIEAAKEAVAAGKDVKVISWVADKNYLAPEIVIGGWQENVPRNIEYCIEKIANGEPGGHFAIGLKEGAVALNPFYGLVPPEVEEQVVDALSRYLADPTSIPTLEVRTDL